VLESLEANEPNELARIRVAVRAAIGHFQGEADVAKHVEPREQDGVLEHDPE